MSPPDLTEQAQPAQNYNTWHFKMQRNRWTTTKCTGDPCGTSALVSDCLEDYFSLPLQNCCHPFLFLLNTNSSSVIQNTKKNIVKASLIDIVFIPFYIHTFREDVLVCNRMKTASKIWLLSSKEFFWFLLTCDLLWEWFRLGSKIILHPSRDQTDFHICSSLAQ